MNPAPAITGGPLPGAFRPALAGDLVAVPQDAARDRADTAPTIASESDFAAIYLANYPAVAGAIYRRTGDAHVTEDLTADVFLAAYASMHRYQPGTFPIRVWLLRIATNRVNRWARRRAGLSGILRRLASIRPTHTDSGQPDLPSALAALLKLPPSYQAVLSLHHLEGLSLEETALVLACPVTTVKSRLARARDALRSRLESQEPRS